MDPEIWVGVLAVFVSGGAIGSAGTLLAQWLLRRWDGASRHTVEAPGIDALRAEVSELHRHLRNMDARLDFTEQLLDGAIPTSPAPERLQAPEAGYPAGEREE